MANRWKYGGPAPSAGRIEEVHVMKDGSIYKTDVHGVESYGAHFNNIKVADPSNIDWEQATLADIHDVVREWWGDGVKIFLSPNCDKHPDFSPRTEPVHPVRSIIPIIRGMYKYYRLYHHIETCGAEMFMSLYRSGDD